MAKILALTLLVLLGLLQHGLWRGNGSLSEAWQLGEQIDRIKVEIKGLEERNAAHAAEVYDLKHGSDAIEERARSEMGMIAPGETFYLLIHADAPPGVDE